MKNLNIWVIVLLASLRSYWDYFATRERVVGPNHSAFLRLASWLLKCFLLMVAGFSLALILLGMLGIAHLSWMLLWLVGPLLARLAVIVACVLAAAVILESVRR